MSTTATPPATVTLPQMLPVGTESGTPSLQQILSGIWFGPPVLRLLNVLVACRCSTLPSLPH